jgi:aerobic-type carbon monoxide dehydrogenase small subunit (CoxS/CutS family)
MGEDNGRKRKTFSRRDFLKGLGSGALGAAVTPKLLAKDVSFFQTKKGSVPIFGKKEIILSVNEKEFSLVVEPKETLLHVIREKLNLTGTKKICGRGECGGCTVLLEEEPVYSCMFPAFRAHGKKVLTVEGLASVDKLHPLQQAFIDKDGYQCGFCTSGFLMSSVSFLKKNKNPKLNEIKQALSGNLCRCGNYTRIYDALSTAAENMRRN